MYSGKVFSAEKSPQKTSTVFLSNNNGCFQDSKLDSDYKNAIALHTQIHSRIPFPPILSCPVLLQKHFFIKDFSSLLDICHADMYIKECFVANSRMAGQAPGNGVFSH